MRELNGRANQLARHLRALGVGPDQLVGDLRERSVEMVVGLLGILKAGRRYLPLDPNYPTERLRLHAGGRGAAGGADAGEAARTLPPVRGRGGHAG